MKDTDLSMKKMPVGSIYWGEGGRGGGGGGGGRRREASLHTVSYF